MGMTGYQDARRNGRNGTALATVSLALVGGVICVGALVLGILAMIHKS